ncbi:MAG: hypothetical protein NZ869_04110 [Thermoanaerobaculum sp.]|nr:hypothetical protein [Thermoanaerobaculum sp.]MDW7968468.1 hypothetical protein [Thermoanaerobaculum sp.]
MGRVIFTLLTCIITLTGGLLAAQEVGAPPPAPPATATPQPLQPSDPRLVQIVELVRAGLSESLIAEHVGKMHPGFRLTTQDLLYLKHNAVPESIIAALMATGKGLPPGEPTPTPTPPPVREADGLVLDRGLGKKDHVGKLVVSSEEIRWVDRQDTRGSFTIYPKGIRQVTLHCRYAGGAPFCYQLEIKMVAGDTFEFEDEARERGGNQAILQAVAALKAIHPQLTVVEKTR